MKSFHERPNARQRYRCFVLFWFGLVCLVWLGLIFWFALLCFAFLCFVLFYVVLCCFIHILFVFVLF